MGIQIPRDISVDFANSRYIILNAKQYDTRSRFIRVTCTNLGQNVHLTPDDYSAFIRYRKSDGYSVFNKCIISTDGKVIFELTEQMLSTVGTSYADLVIIDTLKSDINNDTTIISADGKIIENNNSLVSTMNFYINVLERPLNDEDIVSTNEFSALNELLNKANKDYEYIVQTTKEYMDNAALSETNAATSAQTASEMANQSTNNAKDAVEAAKKAKAKADDATTAAINAENSATDAALSETNAATSAQTASEMADEAANSADSASKSSSSAAENAKSAASSSDVALTYAIEAKSYVHGGTGTREDEENDNAKKYYEQVKNISENIVTIISYNTQYQQGISGTEIPNGEWSASIPSVIKGEYLWTRTTINFSNGQSLISYGVSYFGKDGSGGNADEALSIRNPHNMSDRISSANIDFSDSQFFNKITYMLATPATTEGKPPEESAVINLGWDNFKYGAQIAVGMFTGRGFLRKCDGTGIFSGWSELFDTYNYSGLISKINNRLRLAKGSYVVHETGTLGVAGYINFMQLKITGVYCNYPIIIEVHGRGSLSCVLSILFNSENNLDPSIKLIEKYGNCGYEIFYCKTTAGVWDFYIQKSENNGGVDISRLHTINPVVDIIFPDIQVSSTDSSWLKVPVGGEVEKSISILNLYDVKTRPTSLNIDFSKPEYQNKITFMLATGRTTEGMPPANAVVLNLGWDNGKWGSQVAVGNGTGHIVVRGFNADRDAWGDWFTVLDTFNYGSYCIPKAGGNVDGTLVMQDVTIFDGKNNQKIMQAFDDGDSGNFGCELVIGGNGNTFIGSGESPTNLRTALQAGLSTGDRYAKNAERMYISADTDIMFYSNCNTIADRKGFMFDNNACLSPLSDEGASIGLQSRRWESVYATNIYSTLNIVENVRPSSDGHGSVGTSDYHYGYGYIDVPIVKAVRANPLSYSGGVNMQPEIDMSSQSQIIIKQNNNTFNRGILISLPPTVATSYPTLRPTHSGYGDIGTGSYAWHQIYAVNSTISTSDRRLKKEISYIGKSSGYENTFMSDETFMKFMRGLLPCIYKLIDGDSGRPHHGFISQDVEELLTKLGIKDHAAFIKSPKTRDVEIEKEVKKEDGTVEIIKEMVQEEIPGEYVYSLRYEEFISDTIRFCQIVDKKMRFLKMQWMKRSRRQKDWKNALKFWKK